MMQFKEEDINRLILACHTHQETSVNSDYLYLKYQQLKEKLIDYKNQITTD